MLPEDEPIYKIDLNTRTITGPEFLSVAKDHNSEMVYFIVDRYYEHYDLAKTTCLISYKNKTTNKSSIYSVPFYDLSNEHGEKKVIDTSDSPNEIQTIVFPWCIDGLVTEEAGDVEYSVRFYSIGEDLSINYCLNTIPTIGKVKYGLDVDTGDYLNRQSDAYTELKNDIAQLSQWQNLYWDIIE